MSAIIPYLQPGALTNAQSDITDLQTLSGMPDNSLTHGTFSGVTIPDGQTTKQALQALETEVELRDSDIIQSKVGTGLGYRFDGVDDRIITIDNNTINQNAWTWVVEVDPGDASSIYAIIGALGTGAFTNRRYLRYDNGQYNVIIGNSTTPVVAKAWPVGKVVVAVTHDAATSKAVLYINGKQVDAKVHANQFDVDVVPITTAGIGHIVAANYFKGTMYGVRLFNRALTDSEIAQVSNGQYLGFADYGASGAPSYESDFSVDADGWTAVEGTATGNVDGIGGQDDVLELQCNTATGTHYLQKGSSFALGKRAKVSGKYYIPSSNSHVDGIRIYPSHESNIVNDVSPAKDTWINFSGEVTPTNSQASTLLVLALDGGVSSITDPGGDDKIYIKDIIITPIGEVLRLSGNGAAPTIWADESGNGYNCTLTGATLIGQRALHADSFVSITNLPTSSAGLATGRVWNDSGTLKIV